MCPIVVLCANRSLPADRFGSRRLQIAASRERGHLKDRNGFIDSDRDRCVALLGRIDLLGLRPFNNTS